MTTKILVLTLLTAVCGQAATVAVKKTAGAESNNELPLFSGTSGELIAGSGTVVTSAGLAILDDADATAQRVTLGLVIGTNVQAYDADLTTWAGVTPGTGVATLLATPTSTNLAAALTNETGADLAVFSTSPYLTTPDLDAPNFIDNPTFEDDVKFTFTPSVGFAKLNVGSIAGDPTTPSNGDLWYDSTANELTARINGANGALVATGSTGTVTGTMIVDDTIDGTDIADTLTLDANLTITGAFAHNYGNNTATTVTIDTDGTGDAELVVPDGSISGTEILDDTVDSADYAAASIDNEHLADNAVGNAEMADDAVDSAEIADGAVDLVHLANDASRIVTKSTAASYTVGTTNSRESYGGVVYVTAAATITLPAVADGMSVTIITVGAVAVSVDPNASDKLVLDGVTLDDGDKATNTSTTGDIIVLTYYSADGWYAASDGWTDTGA